MEIFLHDDTLFMEKKRLNKHQPIESKGRYLGTLSFVLLVMCREEYGWPQDKKRLVSPGMNT